MKSVIIRYALGVALAAALPVSSVAAEEAVKTLPTLVIKGEVVSVDSGDPSAVLLKVKDRYGFETPIYLPQDAKIMQGDATLTAASLTAGTGVEVEYNFDINTAKRHAVSVKVAAAAAAPAETAATPAATEAVPTTPAAPAAQAVTPTPEATAPAQSSAPTAQATPAAQTTP